MDRGAVVAAEIERLSIPEPNSGCWLWLGSINGEYPTLSLSGRNVYAHRASYEAHHGALAKGKLACHRCDVPLCVNPAHLFEGSYADNARDCLLKGRWSHGSRHGMAKLDEAAVLRLRARRAAGEATTALAADFGINPAHVRKIVARKLWRQVA